MNDEIRLTIPAKAEMLLVARMTLSGFCSQRGADLDTLEDIRILSDEACYCLMHQPCPVESLVITASAEEGQARIRFKARRAATMVLSGEPHDPEIARGILSTLASEVVLKQDGSSMHAIEVAVRIQPL